MTRSVSRGISSKARTISASRRPVSVVVGTAAHMPCVELAAELLDERSSSSRDARGRPRRSAARHGPGACAGTSSRRLCQSAAGAGRRAPRAGARRGRQAEDVHRAGARADARAGRRERPPTRCSRARARPRAACSRARGGRRARDECVQPEPCAAPSGWRSPGIASRRSPSKKTSSTSSRWPPVTTTASRAERVQRPGELASGVVRRPRAPPASTARLGRFGVITVARGSSSLDDRRAGRVVEQHGAGLGDHHRVDHDRRRRVEQVERLVDGARRSRPCRACRSSPRRRRCPRRPRATCSTMNVGRAPGGRR